AVSRRLVARRRRRRRDARGLCHTGVARLCRACRPASAGRGVRLPAGWSGLRAAGGVPSTGDRAHLRHLADGRRIGRGDAGVQRYAEGASRTSFVVAGLCVSAWLFRLSALVQLISDSILVGFKAGAGLTIAMTQLPSLIGAAGGGHNFFERAALLATQLGETR